MVNKEKIYDELTNELGCPLDVVFKLRTAESILVKGYGNEFKTWETDSFQLAWVKEPYILVFTNDGYALREYKLKDYKKTWWLSSDLEEKEND